MKCVVLLGFSTTGKTSILRDFRECHGDGLDTLDSDELISQPDGGHIYNVFLRFRKGSSTAKAISIIEDREHEFLRTAGPRAKPMLLASGPFLPVRQPEWSNFLTRVRPACFYLQKDPADVLDGLLKRRAKHMQNVKLASNIGFGCWDQDVTTEYRKGRWVELDRHRMLANVSNNMAGMVRIYQQVASRTFTWQEQQTSDGRERLNKAICEELGI
jgi:hypothetical protein